MLKEAIEKITKEMEANKSKPYVQYVGQYLLDNIKESSAENILKEGKTIDGSMKHMENVAKKQKVGNVAVLTPDQGFKAVMEYFEIKEAIAVEENKKISLELDDLFE